MHGWALRTDDTTDPDLTEFRVDRAAPLRPIRKTREGFLIVQGFAARPGVLSYRRPDGSTRRELVIPETLVRNDTLRGKPVTLRHPEGKRVTPENAGRMIAGSVTDVSVDPSGLLRTDLTIMRADAIAAINKGTVELSPGYAVRLDETPGSHPTFGAYDAIQKERVYNHLALCDNARGGSQLRIRTDAAIELPLSASTGEDHTMHPLLITLLATLGVRTDNLDTENPEPHLRDANTKAGEIIGERDTATGRADALDAAKPTDEQTEEAQRAYFNERLPLIQLGAHFNVDGLDAMPNTEIRKAVAIKATPSAKADGSDAYYAALCDVASERIDAADKADAADPFAGLGTGFGKKRTDSDDDRNDDDEIPSATRAYLESTKAAAK